MEGTMHRPDRVRRPGLPTLLPVLLAALALVAGACGDEGGGTAEGDAISAGEAADTADGTDAADTGTGDTGTGGGDASDDGGDADDELPNDCPVEGCVVTIEGAEAADGGEIQLTFDANYTPDFERNHIHVYWDSYEAGAVSSDYQDQGYDEQGHWDPTDAYPTYLTQGEAAVASELRQGSTTLCVTAADTGHAVIDASIVDCMDVGDLVG